MHFCLQEINIFSETNHEISPYNKNYHMIPNKIVFVTYITILPNMYQERTP